MAAHCNRSYDLVIIGGLGHVGLPLGLSFANAGLRVCLYDVNEGIAETVRSGKMPFVEYDAEPILQKVLAERTLEISLDKRVVGLGRYVIIALGTPVDQYLGPKMRSFMDEFMRLRSFLDPDQILIVRSTVFPRTCQQLHKMLTREAPPWHIAYCPERIMQGHAIKELRELPQLVAGVTRRAQEEAAKLFAKIAPRVLMVSLEEAELAKLFTNTWRYIQFAVANQFYMIAHEFGVDFNRLRHVMKEGYDRMSALPGAGFSAGPCLLKDTMQLAGACPNTFFLGQAAMMVNEGLPNFLVNDLGKRHDLSSKTVGILGMAFKADVDDTRDSLSFKIKNILKFHGADVLCSDEYIQAPPASMEFVSKEELLTRSRIVIVGVPHRQYKDLAVPEHVEEVVDLWGVLDKRRGKTGPNQRQGVDV